MIRERSNYFGKWALAKKQFAEVKECLSSGGIVMVSTYTKSTQYDKPEHINLFRMGKDGLYTMHGKRMEFIGGCAVRLYHRK